MSETKEEKRKRKEEKKLAKAKKAEAKAEKKSKDVVEETNESVDDQNTEINEDNEKRKDLEEIEIDLKGDIPLNKKQQRLLKKGKLNLQKLKAKHPNPIAEGEESDKPEKGKYGVWVGNLSFDTIKDDIVNLITARTTVTEDNIKRINIPKGKNDKIKGFCYIDFENEEQVEEVVKLSETNLNGRNLLIKNSKSFEGRPDAPKPTGLINISKNPPSRILFVGNLSFDTSEELLREHFSHCGEIVRVRMATFEDTGKCKGFAFLDFKDETGPTNALTSKTTKFFINRPLRMEFGEDRSKRQPKRRFNDEDGEARTPREDRGPREDRPPREGMDSRPERSEPRPERKIARERFREDKPAKRLKSSIALASAQRASAAIVPSAGKKTTFD
ncbi:nucleolar protein 13 [[Candida] jaroonii]|uniref:Nucleolar protein 13 n=1 Tax=[Candida] jaroonii TaxID=467808 RepID=A0ACA9Y3D0_9ASCO|nr:nucleolar protein 13 [[Candida] jaroonii]